MNRSASLRPVSGSPGEIESLVGRWLSDTSAPALTIRTSGSSGRPKDVELAASALRASALASLARLGGAGAWVLALPPRYVAGLQVIVRSILAGMSPVVLADHADLSSATRALPPGRRYLAVVPTQLYRWLHDPSQVDALQQYDAVLLGGAAAPSGLLAEASQQGLRIVASYGMSETCGGCVYDGVALDGVAVALGVDGSIRVAGPVLFDGYAGEPDLTQQVLRDGWLATADVGRFDLDGRLVVLGRADDMVTSGGVNVPLAAVEARLTDMPGVSHVAVDSRGDSEWGARVVAVMVFSGPPPLLQEVRAFVAAKHPRAWAPRELVVVDSLPLLVSGKVDRQGVRQLLDSRHD